MQESSQRRPQDLHFLQNHGGSTLKDANDKPLEEMLVLFVDRELRGGTPFGGVCEGSVVKVPNGMLVKVSINMILFSICCPRCKPVVGTDVVIVVDFVCIIPISSVIELSSVSRPPVL